MTLEEILGKLVGEPDYQMEESLKGAIENEKEEKEKLNLLLKGTKIFKIEKLQPKNLSALPDEERKKAEGDKAKLKEIRALAGKMAGIFSRDDIEFFVDKILCDKYIQFYRGGLDGVQNPEKIPAFDKKFDANLDKFLKENHYEENEIKVLIEYFHKLNDIIGE